MASTMARAVISTATIRAIVASPTGPAVANSVNASTMLRAGLRTSGRRTRSSTPTIITHTLAVLCTNTVIIASVRAWRER